jgi:hypothetical protein
MSIQVVAIIKKSFGLMYFCSTQTGISHKSATRFQNHKKSPTRRADSKTSQKK